MISEKREIARKLTYAASLIERGGSFETNCSEMLQRLGAVLQWNWIALWHAPQGATSLWIASIWASPLVNADPLRLYTLNWRPSAGEGMVGNAWAERRSLLSIDLIKDMVLPRSLHAQAAGFSSGVWIPVHNRETEYGVVECLGSVNWAMLNQQVILLEQFVGQLAQSLDKVRP